MMSLIKMGKAGRSFLLLASWIKRSTRSNQWILCMAKKQER